jgi:glycine/D-amino acid oxidase-like deaminating enzyme
MPASFYDVAIIGAGVHGASAAFHLASRGRSVIVFDKGTPAGGPTGRSSGIVRAYYTNPFLARVANDSIAMFESFSEVTGGGDAGFHRTGFLFLHPGSDLERSVANAEVLNDVGVIVDVFNQDVLKSEFPMFDLDEIGCGIWERHAGYADPASTTVGLLEAAVRRGAQPRMRTPIVELDVGERSISLVAADGSRVGCERVLLAAGPWTAVLAEQVGAHLPLTVERHVVATGAWGAADPLPFGHADLVNDYYCKPEGDHLFCLGWLKPAERADPDRYGEAIAAEETEDLFAAATGRVKSLDGAEPRRGWAGLYDVSPDWQPVIGEITENVFVDAGTSGHGFKLAPALGRHVADLVTGEPVDTGLEQFHPRRFDEAALLTAGWGAARILG